jgi:L-glutamine:scyllo-inosose aminotransferase/L-glutamine:2-deoxy-scyllo-inosose/3-amino-2,3-dideoxy-scyllo-inosose aminotransferase
MSSLDRKYKLAVLGGIPIRERPWPKWPRADSYTKRMIIDVLYSGRWAISGPYKGSISYERRFAKAFAKFNGSMYCVPTMNGTSALTIALLALGVGPGDEVLVPGLTWVACASSVFATGAVPILVDIEPNTLCMSLESARNSITSKTKAIIVVHLFCSVANLDGFTNLSEETSIPIIEDCSQAHGAMWKGRRVGTFGKIGTFSMQQSKVLTCGEGGAAITSDSHLYALMEQLRSDGRMFVTVPKLGRLELYEAGEIQGHNMCLSEFQAAILLDRLKHLEEENNIREKRATYLANLLANIEGIKTLSQYPKVTSQTYYNFVVQLDLEKFMGNTIDAIARALSAELQTLVNPVYMPLNNHVLYNPLSSPRCPRSIEEQIKFNPKTFSLPVADEARKTCLTFTHPVLLDNEAGMHDIVDAFIKVKRWAKELLLTQQEPLREAF